MSVLLRTKVFIGGDDISSEASGDNVEREGGENGHSSNDSSSGDGGEENDDTSGI